MFKSKVLNVRALFPEKGKVYCPIADCPSGNHLFNGSTYLGNLFADDPKAKWLANMVTHYRHNHIKSWNRNWGYNGHYYRKAYNFTKDQYARRKHEINERAKRQIARKAKAFLLANGIGISTLLKLEGTEQETIDLWKKLGL